MATSRARNAMVAWPKWAELEIEPLGRGLINQTWAVGEEHVLQWVNPIFGPRVHENIDAVCQHLHARGFATPMLVRTRRDELCSDTEDGCWRLMTRVRGKTHAHARDPDMVRAAAYLAGRWHACLADLDHEFIVLREGVHDTPKHLATLARALEQHPEHRLAGEVAPLAERILRAAVALPPLEPGAVHTCHGDLKLDNIVFDGGEAIALIDLDTVGPMPFAHELGDAWRSWCNPADEDQAASSFDVARFESAWRGWSAGWNAELGGVERAALLLAPEWIALELSARFCADALNESYFGFDAEKYMAAGEHNLVRARAQFEYFESTRATRDARSRVLELG